MIRKKLGIRDQFPATTADPSSIITVAIVHGVKEFGVMRNIVLLWLRSPGEAPAIDA
jgi:hypothetical protein